MLSKFKLALAFVMGIVVVGAAAYLVLLYMRNADQRAAFNLVFYTFEQPLPVGLIALGGALGGALGAGALLGLWQFRNLFATRILRREIEQLRAELHAFRTLPLEAPTFLTADSRGRVAAPPPREPPGPASSAG